MKQNRVRALVRIMMVLALAVFGARTASAQFGKIDGKVKDAAGAAGKAIPNATVVIVGQAFTTTTNKDGYYFFNNVPAGVYEVSVTAIGFKPAGVTGLRVVTNQTVAQDFTLAAGAAVTLQAITASASQPLVNPQKSTSSQTLNADYVHNLPEQRINTLLALQPGVSRPLTGDTTRLAVRGSRYTENVMILDGVPVQSVTGNGGTFDVATNAFEDVTLTTGAPTSQFGNALGGVINITTRSGTSRFVTALQWDTGMLGGTSATGTNTFNLNFSGPLPLKGLTFSTNARLEGTAWTNTGYRGDLFPGFSTVGIDTTFNVPRSNTTTGTTTFNNPRADSIHFNVYQTAVISGDCSNFWFVKDASTADMRNNYGVTCAKSRTFVSPSTTYLLNGSLAYRFGGSSSIRLSYNWNGSQSRPRLVGDGRVTGTISNAAVISAAWSQTLFRKGTHNLNINATYSIQPSNTTSSPITIASEKSSRSPFSGFMLKKLDLVYGEKDFPIDSTIIKAFLTQGIYRTSLIPPSTHVGANTGSQSASTVSAGLPSDGVPYRDANGGGSSDVNLSWQWETRKVAQVNLDAQIDRYNRVTAMLQQTNTEAKNFSGSAASATWFRPVSRAASLEDKLDLSDVVVTAGVRYDYFNNHLMRWNNFPRISTAVGFDPTNPDTVMRPDKAHDYIAPRIQVAFPVTQQTNFRLSYAQQVQSPPFSQVIKLHDYDIQRSGINSRSSFGYDIGFAKNIAFEFGVAHAFSDNMVLDVDFYNKDNLADAQIEYVKKIDPVSGQPQQLYLLTNNDFGNSRGIEISLDRQIGSYLNGRLNYSYADVKNTGSDPTSFLTFFEGIVTGDAQPPATPLPVAQSTPHTLNGTVTIGLPADFKRGTLFGKIVNNTSMSATFQLQSGTPYTRCDPNLETNVTLKSGSNCTTIDAVEGYNQSRLPMTKSLNTQFRRNFNIGKYQMAAYLTVNNILNLTNIRQVYATTGTTTNPLVGLANWTTDSTSFISAAIQHGFLAGSQMVLPTSTAGCAKVSNSTNSLVESCFYWIRSEQRFGNGDGIYTLDEWHRVSTLKNAKSLDISSFVNGFRTMRFGMSVTF